MVACDICDEWFHGDCIGITPETAEQIKKYVCIECKEEMEIGMNNYISISVIN